MCEVALRDYLASRGALSGDAATAEELIAIARELGLPAAIEALRKKLRTAAAGKKEAA
jgi:hypothetical protein